MRSWLAKSGVTLLVVLALGSGLTLAATTSEPGMFLYPIKQTTQKLTRATGRPAQSLTPVIEIPQDGPDKPSPSGVDLPAADVQEDVAEGPDVTDSGQAMETIASPEPTPVRVVDEITVNVEPEAATVAGPESVDDASGPPAIEQLGSGAVDDGRNDDGQSEASQVSGLKDGQAGKNEKGNDNDSSHSDSDHDNESNDNREDHDD